MTETPRLREPASTSLRAVDNLAGPAGRLEALLNQISGAGEAPYSALVCHPHPLGGGTMHNKVVYRAMKTLLSFGLPVLRFNFRGAGLSEGAHDDGRGEVDDVRAALEWLEREFARPILFCGFSFGAYTGLRACCGDARVTGIAALGTPIRAAGRSYTYGFLRGCPQPKLFLSGAEDQFAPRAELAAAIAAAPTPTQLVFIDGADHFFAGKLEQMRASLHSWTEALFFPPSSA